MSRLPDISKQWAVYATTGCSRDGNDWMGVEWDERDVPVAPADAVAEWLRRLTCEICGSKGCVVVDSVSVYAPFDDDQADEDVPPVSVYERPGRFPA